jgi:hypothetical protein
LKWKWNSEEIRCRYSSGFTSLVRWSGSVTELRRLVKECAYTPDGKAALHNHYNGDASLWIRAGGGFVGCS